MARGFIGRLRARTFCGAMGALLALVFVLAAFPLGGHCEQEEADHAECPLSHCCCMGHSPAIAAPPVPSIGDARLLSSSVTELDANEGITLSAAPFQPPRA